jgi:DNA-directed RNA polymerase specialized sigma subunit
MEWSIVADRAAAKREQSGLPALSAETAAALVGDEIAFVERTAKRFAPEGDAWCDDFASAGLVALVKAAQYFRVRPDTQRVALRFRAYARCAIRRAMLSVARRRTRVTRAIELRDPTEFNADHEQPVSFDAAESPSPEALLILAETAAREPELEPAGRQEEAA